MFQNPRFSWLCLLVLVLLLVLVPVPIQAQSPEEQLAAASALFDAKKYPEAATRLEAFLKANAKHAKAGAAAFTLARCYAELMDWPKAVTAYEKAVASKDKAVLTVAQLGLGEAAVNAGQYAKAAAALDLAVKQQLKLEQAPVAWYLLGQARLELQQFPQAEAAYEKLIQGFPRSELVESATFGAGIAALRQGKADEARGRLKTVVDRYPKSLDRLQALLLLAQIDFEAKRYREARAGFEAVLRDPNAKVEGPEFQAAAEEGLVGVLLELEDYATAASRLEAVIRKLPAADPQRARAQLSLGHCRYRQKQHEPALAAYREAAKSTEGVVAGEGHYWAGNVALALKRPAEAAVEFGKVASRFPKHELAARAQYLAGEAYLEAKKTDEATAAYRAVLDRYPDSPEVAEARKGLARLVDAVDDPVKLAAALKSAPPAERARGTLRLARLYLQGRKWGEAEAPLVELLKSKPEAAVIPEARYLLGLAYEGQGKAAPAAAAFAEALRLNGKSEWAVDAQSRLAWLYLELKKPVDAEKTATAALARTLPEEPERQVRLALLQAQLDQEKWGPALENCRRLLSGKLPPETTATVFYMQAWATEKSGKSADAVALWEKLAAEHGQSPYAPEALVRIGDARFAAEKWEEAREKYAVVVSAHPKSPVAVEARYKLGSALFHLERLEPAAAEWDRVAADKSAGEYVPEALYWAGVALDKAEKDTEAVQRLSRLVTDHPKHARVKDARIRLAALKAVLGK